jgi:mono/diheme cytochrome c family protein
MLKNKTLFAFIWVTSVVLFAYACHPVIVFAQSGTPAAKPAAVKLTPDEIKGEGMFLEHCALCHLPVKEKSKSTPSYGPPLRGIFRADDPDVQDMLREIILKGSDRMPAWQYALTPKEIDELVAYLKVM